MPRVRERGLVVIQGLGFPDTQSQDARASVTFLQDSGVGHLSKNPPLLAPPSQYLGPKAKLVNGVLSLCILGEELVIVLL